MADALSRALSMPVEERLATMASYDHERHVADAVAAADALGGEPVAVIGFCMGGMGALRAAATGRFDKAAAFYGMIRLPAAFKGQWQGEPLTALAKGSVTPLLAVIGDKDPYTPPEDVAELQALGIVTPTAVLERDDDRGVRNLVQRLLAEELRPT